MPKKVKYTNSKAVLKCEINMQAVDNGVKLNFKQLEESEGYDQIHQLVQCIQNMLKSSHEIESKRTKN